MSVSPAPELLIEDLKRVAKEEGNWTMMTYRMAGAYSESSLLYHFGKWAKACEAAGLPMSKTGRKKGK
jgi:hypothetical protein